ncbi:MAG: hypothetical protein CK518_02335 [Actinobacteria bacterium]|nr:hypothetical protein [Candidatus Planktophila sp.]PHX66802.1 MAG: hypothetical protein CK518_02335 [Actinomycetota bacterium]
MESMEDYLALHPHFEYSYFLIGLLEVSLREHVPLALSNYHATRDTLRWYEKLPLNEKGSEALQKAVAMNPEAPEHHLPLPFWRYLFSARNYGSLWLPVLHMVFPQLLDAKNISSFKLIDKYFDSALRLRNNVAHYNLSSGQTLQFSQEKVRWLLLKLDISEELLVKP